MDDLGRFSSDVVWWKWCFVSLPPTFRNTLHALRNVIPLKSLAHPHAW